MARQQVACLRHIISGPLDPRGPHHARRNHGKRHVINGCVPIVIFLAALMVPLSATAAPVRTMFNGAAAKEQAVRAALVDPAASITVLKSVRQAVASYESVVRRYPTSGYSDDALWQAAHLALDAFEKFGDAQDRETGLRLLRWLAAEYPTSKLAKRVPDLLATTEGAQKDGGRASSLRPASTTAKARPDAVAVITSKTASLTNIQRSLLPDVVRVTIALDSEVAYHEERIAGPSRIFIDFPATRPTASLLDRTLRFDKDGDSVRQVRIGRQPNATTRVVLDAAGISSYSVYPVYNPYRLVIDCVRTSPVTAPRENVAVAKAAPATVNAGQPKPELTIDPARTKPVVGAELVRPRLPIAGRHLAAVSLVTLPRVIPNATELLKAARVPPILTSHRLANGWGRSLPNASPIATEAILDAVRTPATLASRTVASAWTRGLPNASPVASAAVFDATREPATLTSRSLSAASIRSLPAASPARTAAIAEALAPPAPETAPVVAAITPTAPPLPAEATPGHGGGFSMARQLGLGVSRIVIDPGHGGHDPGAKGKGGITEAELVLDVSLRLEKLLAAVPGVEVLLTRHADEFVALAERTAIANREGADLFLSIHANANVNEQVNGVETYFLNFANNLSAAAVAARENATSGQAMGALPDFVRAIALNNKLDESRDFATLVQQSMVDRLRTTNKSIKSLGVKQAPFVVLIGASMPSVLTEVSFLTHEQEAKLLKSSAYRQRIAEALFEAVRQYQGSLQRVQTVAHQ